MRAICGAQEYARDRISRLVQLEVPSDGVRRRCRRRAPHKRHHNIYYFPASSCRRKKRTHGAAGRKCGRPFDKPRFGREVIRRKQRRNRSELETRCLLPRPTFESFSSPLCAVNVSRECNPPSHIRPTNYCVLKKI